MVMSTCGGGSGSSSGSGSGVEPTDERICKFVSSEINRGILDVTLVMFGTIKEGIMEILDECHMAFWVEILAGELGLELSLFGSSRLVDPHSSLGLRTLLLAINESLTWRMLKKQDSV